MSTLFPDSDLEMHKHLWNGLKRLTAPQRIAFLKRLCTTASFGGVEPRITKHTGEVAECLHDINMLALQHSMPLQTAAIELDRVLRRL